MIDRLVPGLRRAIDRYRISSEYVVRGKPIFFLPAGRKDAEFPDIVEQFEKCGYVILENLWTKGYGARIPSDSSCLGYFADERFVDLASREAMFDTVQGLQRPHQYTFREALDSNSPVIAKDPSADRGEGVIYLKDRQAVAKFAAWRKLLYTEIKGQDPIRTAYDKMVTITSIQVGNWETFHNAVPESWIFQEYIETPSDFHTSFRILVDGYGNIHYGVILRSPEEKGKRRLGGVGYKADKGYSLLFNPSSRLFLDAPNIVSNASQGGIYILLNGEPVMSEIGRQVLTAHKINPDSPAIPEELKRKAIALAVLSKGFFPYLGIDFIYDKSCNDYFLEANVWPTLFAEGLGVTDQEVQKNVGIGAKREKVQEYLRRTLIRRIAQEAKKK